MELSVEPKTDSLLVGKVSMLLSRWNGLQMAIENKWGGHDSLKKSEQLAYDIVSWFSQSKGDEGLSSSSCFLIIYSSEIGKPYTLPNFPQENTKRVVTTVLLSF